MNNLNVSVDGGKYTVIQNADGSLKALRYGQEWQDLTGNNLVLALAQEIDRLRNPPKQPEYRSQNGQHSADECDDPTCSHY